MVREFEDLPGDNLLLVFDPTLLSDDGPESFSRERLDDFEAAVSLAATVASEWRGDRGGRLIAVVAGEDPDVLDGPSGPAHARRVLERLAVVEPLASPSASALAALLDRVGGAAVGRRGGGRVGPRPARGRAAQGAATAGRLSGRGGARIELDFYEPPGV